MIQTEDRTFFASINSCNGFYSDFPSIFDPLLLEKIYILKGGPGTGKSTFMKTVSEITKSKGYTVEHYICSSDPNSLDGIIILEKGIAILDGTSPHTYDPNYPGVVENTINLGSFWNAEKLCKNKSAIISLIKEKKRFYRRANQFLAAYGEIFTEIKNILKEALLAEKMEQNIKRQAQAVFSKNANLKIEKRNIATVNKLGYIKLDSFERISKNVYIVEDHYLSGTMYLKALLDFAISQNQNVFISSSPEDPDLPNGLYFPDSETCFVIGDRNYDKEYSEKNYHYINMNRFLNKDIIFENKQKIRFGQKCMKTLLEGAILAFSDAGMRHEKLERYYISAMDFSKLEETKEMVISEILKN